MIWGLLLTMAAAQTPERSGDDQSRSWQAWHDAIGSLDWEAYEIRKSGVCEHIATGYFREAAAWRDWLLRAAAGSPEQVQIMYGLGGERLLREWEIP